jgi:hypothetical protein
MPKPQAQMTGAEFREWREGRGLSMAEAAKLLSDQLTRSYKANRVGEWERGEVPVPSLVRHFIEWDGKPEKRAEGATLERRYPVQFELLTFDEAAVRCRVTAEAFRKKYTGRVIRKLGEPRISTLDLLSWLESDEGAAIDSWAGGGDHPDED